MGVVRPGIGAIVAALTLAPLAADAARAARAKPAVARPKPAARRARAAAPAAALPDMAGMAKAYAKAHRLPVRQVQIELPGRKVTRYVVPVLPKTAEDFAERFGEANGCMVWRTAYDKVHMTLSLGPKKWIKHSYNGGFFADVVKGPNANLKHQVKDAKQTRAQGQEYYLALGLGGAALEGFEKFLATKGKTQATLQKAYGRKTVNGGCMYWVAQAEVAKGKSLAHHLGVSRSKGPPNLAAKLIHAGNEQVGPLGVAVPNVKAFKALTDAELLGPPPVGGAADAIK